MSTLPPLAGRRVLLTGASGGIGSATARTLLDSGAEVVGQYRSGRDAAEAAVAGPHADRAALLADLRQLASELGKGAPR